MPTRTGFDGFDTFDALCEFRVALALFIPLLYGYRGAVAEEATCVRRGDPICTARVTWPEADEDRRRADFLASKLDLAELRLQTFQQTVRDVVSLTRRGGQELESTPSAVGIERVA